MVLVCQHHSYRTYQGLTCLIQVSTRSEDFVIDSLALREHIHLLNESFTDPKIVKVSPSLLFFVTESLHKKHSQARQLWCGLQEIDI